MLYPLNMFYLMMKVKFFAQENSGWEFDFILLAGCIVLLISGAGSITVDRLWFGI